MHDHPAHPEAAHPEAAHAAAPLTLADLEAFVPTGVAIRAQLRLQPAGGPGTKVFPPTYVPDQNDRHQQTRYATETRRIGGRDLPCVLLDSVASQANRMEEALLAAWEADATLPLPVPRVDFSEADAQLEAPIGSISALQAPHRIYDAIFRDSVDADGTLFRYTPAGAAVTQASPRNATALYHYCPTALLFGAWDSTGPRGGMGSKFPRILASEIVGVDIRTGTKVGGRLDPLAILKKATQLYASQDEREGWTLEAEHSKAKALNPSDINHGNVAPSRSDDAGGVTLDHALQTTVLSLPALRRLRLLRGLDNAPLSHGATAERAAHVALAALGVAAIALGHRAGHDLRSGTLLLPEGPLTLELLNGEGAPPTTRSLTADGALDLLRAAAAAAAAVDLPWQRDALQPLRPAPKLLQLVAQSQKLAIKETAAPEGT